MKGLGTTSGHAVAAAKHRYVETAVPICPIILFCCIAAYFDPDVIAALQQYDVKQRIVSLPMSMLTLSDEVVAVSPTGSR